MIVLAAIVHAWVGHKAPSVGSLGILAANRYLTTAARNSNDSKSCTIIYFDMFEMKVI